MSDAVSPWLSHGKWHAGQWQKPHGAASLGQGSGRGRATAIRGQEDGGAALPRPPGDWRSRLATRTIQHSGQGEKSQTMPKRSAKAA